MAAGQQLLLCVLLWIAAPRVHSEEAFVQIYTPSNAKLHEVNWLNCDNQYLRLRIMGRQGANVVLAKTLRDITQAYEIIIGVRRRSFAPLQIDITDTINGRVVAMVSLPNVINQNTFSDFWITWSEDVIRVGEGTAIGQTEKVSWTAPDGLHPITAVSMDTFVNSDITWQFPRDSAQDLLLRSRTGNRHSEIWFSEPVRQKIIFGARGCAAAKVGLSDGPGMGDARQYQTYVVVLGVNSNRDTVIEKQLGGSEAVSVATPAILSCTETRYFWVSWETGNIQVGKGLKFGDNMFLNWLPDNPHNITSITPFFGSGAGSKPEFHFPNVEKIPEFTNIHGDVGPLSGGTKLTLSGTYLSNLGLIIKLDGVECPTESRNTSTIVCLTPPGAATVLNIPLNIKIAWWVLSAPIHDTMQTFTYKQDPIIFKLEPTDTIASGGTRMTVTGKGLDVVEEAFLQVTVVYETVPVDVYQSKCQIMSSTTMYCLVPASIGILAPDGSIDLSALTTPSPRKRRHVKTLRRRRQADQNQTADCVINNGKLGFHLGLSLDGVPTYRNLSEALPEYSQLTVYIDPELYRWTEVKVVTSANRTLQVKGRRLLNGIQSGDYRMLIGQSECSTLDVSDNSLICTAPKDTLAPHHTDIASGPLSVRVHVGAFKEPFLVGKLHYKLAFFGDPIAKWGIIAAAVVIGLVLVILTIICLFKKCRKSKN